ncbi:hypothetical protein BDN70DRAFT_965243 [Pholiota conissans]|uniref:F-box domain-containing protein n=1 Tax=Pholiota conissans TaxID=109636 RepID=A0A9P5YQ45_9AGAR|nr:hypothetical protein BDN70DRAFT_965243 [Pholiota conissans]
MPPLPPEICDIALDYLHDDIQALVKCSTLCKSWLPTCRLHLYSTVCIPFHASNLEFRLGLINLLCDPRSDHLRPLVRRIIIVGVLQYAGRLLECLEDFTKLERLDLRGIRWIQHSEQRTNSYSLPRAAHFKYLSLQDMSVRFKARHFFAPTD